MFFEKIFTGWFEGRSKLQSYKNKTTLQTGITWQILPSYMKNPKKELVTKNTNMAVIKDNVIFATSPPFNV